LTGAWALVLDGLGEEMRVGETRWQLEAAREGEGERGLFSLS